MTTRTTTAVEFSRTRFESHHTAPFAHAPVGVLAGNEKGRDLTERGLMPDDERGLARVGPSCRCQDRFHRGARSELRHGPEFPLQRERGLLRAIGRAHQDSTRVRKMGIEPQGHSVGLLDALGREPTAEIRLARLGLGVAPKDQIHGDRRFIAARPCLRPAALSAHAARTSAARGRVA